MFAALMESYLIMRVKRRGETFVTRKITLAVARIAKGLSR